MNPSIKCAHTHLIDPRELKPHPKNPNSHPPEQIVTYIHVIEYQGWRRPITISNLSGFITRGHGALEAALKAGWARVPVDYQDYESAAQELADIVADNQLQRLSVMDEVKLSELMVDLKGMDFDISLTAFDMDQISDLTGSDSSDQDDQIATEENPYTRKIKSPLYEPKGEKPDTAELVDLDRVEKLRAEIANAGLPEEVRLFLENAAYRHAVFNYEKIAEFYAHASPEIQRLMEASALVIIDFNQAIERGFVALSDEIAEAYKNG